MNHPCEHPGCYEVFNNPMSAAQHAIQDEADDLDARRGPRRRDPNIVRSESHIRGYD